MQHRDLCGLCTDQKSRVKQQRVQRDRLQSDAFAAHVRAGDDRRAAVGRNRNGNERASLRFQKIDKLRVCHVDKLQCAFRDLRTHTAVFFRKQRFLDEKVQPTCRVRVGEHCGNMGEKRFAHHFPDRAFLGLLLGADARAFGPDRVLFGVRRFVQALFEPLLFRADRS